MRYVILPLLVFLSPLGWTGEAETKQKCRGQYSARLVSLQGKAYFDPGGKGNWQPVQLNGLLCEGSRIKVQPYSRVSLVLSNGIVLRLDQGTVLSLNGIAPQQPTALELIKGFIHFISRTPKQLKISTPIANAGPEGTEFAMEVQEEKASLWVYEGKVRFFNELGSLKLEPGQGAQALAGQAPNTRIDIKPRDAVNWALYYPPILPYPNADTIIGNDIRTSIEDYRHGRVDDALFRLDTVPTKEHTPYFFKVRAAIRLTAGRVNLAQQDIQQIFTSNPNDAEALALQSVMALTQNSKDEAYQLANRSLAADSESASAYSALSYAEQSRFELEKALSAADRATKLAPHDAMVWARKSELELSSGLTKGSEEAAERALALDPGLERTQTITGFSYLLRMEAVEAKEAFEQAVKFDSTSPLARLGLGLAKIRNGDLEEGRKDLEIAAILDPSNAIVRSYLGKAYFEEHRSKMATEQYQLAKKHDPKDPTPYFYDAINKQTTNRPVAALHDIQKAIELNNNRGVYRSSLTLDKDLAARSAAQGRIYNDLGFQRLGLLEGWKSINIDPSNYSIHRLLADNYASEPRHEIARVSELLQSQLLQPLNITPIQPQSAQSNQSNILLLSGLGPSSLSFNEFNPLYTRNRFALQASGIYGTKNTWGEDIVHSGVWDNFSYSLGQFHFGTDGFRKNNKLEQNIYNAFIQGNITNDLNLQFEYRYEEKKNGDLSINFFGNNFSKDFLEKTNVDTYRFGGRYNSTNKSTFLTSLIFQDVNIKQNSTVDFGIVGIFDNKLEQSRKGFIYELQNQYQETNYNLISGFGHIDQSGKEYSSLFASTNNADITRNIFYGYSNIDLNKNITSTIGLSYDQYDIKNPMKFFGKTFNRSIINPKIGLIWKPLKTTTVRGALLRNMNITRTSNQTIEPTQIAGFNQFFDDVDGTIAWRYGGGIDHKLSKDISIGLEYTERKLDVPQFPSYPLDWKEQIGKTYLFMTPNEQLSLSAEYFYEQFNRQKYKPTGGVGNLDTTNHLVPLTIRFFHTSGFSFVARGTYVNQSGLFEYDNNTIKPGNSDFFILDLYLNYRLPYRYGIISLGAKNLLDKKFNYQDINSTRSNNNEYNFAKEQMFYLSATLSFSPNH